MRHYHTYTYEPNYGESYLSASNPSIEDGLEEQYDNYIDSYPLETREYMRHLTYATAAWSSLYTAITNLVALAVVGELPAHNIRTDGY
jgi:hypothetical protein